MEIHEIVSLIDLYSSKLRSLAEQVAKLNIPFPDRSDCWSFLMGAREYLESSSRYLYSHVPVDLRNPCPSDLSSDIDFSSDLSECILNDDLISPGEDPCHSICSAIDCFPSSDDEDDLPDLFS